MTLEEVQQKIDEINSFVLPDNFSVSEHFGENCDNKSQDEKDLLVKIATKQNQYSLLCDKEQHHTFLFHDLTKQERVNKQKEISNINDEIGKKFYPHLPKFHKYSTNTDFYQKDKDGVGFWLKKYGVSNAEFYHKYCKTNRVLNDENGDLVPLTLENYNEWKILQNSLWGEWNE